MAAGDPIPNSFPSMGGYFEKPYMEFEYQGQIHRINNLAGGHNGRVAAACQAHPPQWDEQRQRWVVPVENNIIDIDLNEQRPLSATFAADSRLASLRIVSNPRSKFRSTGMLISGVSNRNETPTFPVDCEFRMFIRVSVPGRPRLINIAPFRLIAEGVDQWPPAVGTRYRNLDTIDLFPEYIPFFSSAFSPLARILPGDEAVLTEVFVR